MPCRRLIQLPCALTTLALCISQRERIGTRSARARGQARQCRSSGLAGECRWRRPDLPFRNRLRRPANPATLDFFSPDACLSSPVAAQLRAGDKQRPPPRAVEGLGFAMADAVDRNRRAYALVDCLGDVTDPQLRATASPSRRCRPGCAANSDAAALRSLQRKLLGQLAGAMRRVTASPFAALVRPRSRAPTACRRG